MICCPRGKGRDYVVDLRKHSRTYKKWIWVDLDEESRRQVLVPPGYGHAFLSLEDRTQMIFRIDREFDPALSRTVSYKDKDLNISFPVKDPVLAPWDRDAPSLRESGCNL